ncbi:alpha/beta hydrolase [Ferrovibrio sp. MS7]|uniref:alpha/beta fold hydrolase n=1 Tax=Ferrovibrio plantarum TaxID=3119164 RepID=UPI0031367EDB
MRYSHQVTSGQAHLAAAVTGDGIPVVFLHAAICDSRKWQAQWQAVGGQYRAIAYDRRGFGASHAEKQDHSAVGDLLAVIDALADGKPAILVACSQGGRIALDAAILHPERIRGLFLISPSLIGAPEPQHAPEIAALLAEQKRAEAAGDAAALNQLKARLWLDGPLQPEGRVSGAARELFLEMNGIALRAPPVGANTDAVANYLRLGEIAAPAMILCGAYDFPYIQERGRQIARMMPKASFEPLPGTAHLPSLEQPALISERLLSFLKQLNTPC